MFQDVTVDFGSLSISSYLDKNFVLTVSTSMLLSVPAQCPDIPTAADLRDQVQAGSLWITRAGSCHVELSIGFVDSPDGGSQRNDLQRMIVEAFENFPVWDAFGLDLRREYNQFNELRGSRSLYPYSVQHHQQNASLVAPNQVPCAYLCILTCNFTLRSKGTLVNMARSKPSSKPTNTKIITLSISPRNLQSIASTKQHRDGSTEQSMPLPRKSRTVTLAVSPGELRRILGVPDIYSVASELQETRLQHLTHSALHSIFGSRKRFVGIIFLEKSGSPSVLDVAPAVWNFRYFQDVVSRAQLTSLISSALGNLTSTESPNVRYKIQSLGVDPAQELHRQTLLLILRSTRIPRSQFRLQRTGSQSQTSAHFMTGYDEVYHPSESQEVFEDREAPGPGQNKPLNDSTLSLVEAEVDPRADSGPDLAYGFSSSTYQNDSEVYEPLVLEYGMPCSYSKSSASQSILEEDLQERWGFDNDPLLDGEAFQDDAVYGSQGDDHLEQQDDLVFDVMDEGYREDANVYAMEEPAQLADRIFEHEQGYSPYDRHDSVRDTQLYDDGVVFEDYQQVYSDAGPLWEHHLAYRQQFHELDDTGDMEEDRSDEDYWTEQDLMIEPDSVSSPYGVEQTFSEYDDKLMDVRYETDSLDYVTAHNPGELGEVYQYEDMSIQPNDSFTNEDTAVTATGQSDSAETESVLEGPQDVDIEDREYDDAEDEVGSAGENFYMIGSDRVSHLSTGLIHYHFAQESGLDERVSCLGGVPGQRNWAAPSFWADSHSSSHGPTPSMDC